MSVEDKFYLAFLHDLEHDKLVLPTLPEIALKIRDAVEKENSTIPEIASVISLDPALSARIIQIANSPLLRGTESTETIESAIMRMGNNLVKNMVTSLAMEQIFQATSPATEVRQHQIWEQSTQVAAICHVLAQQFTNLSPDQALLAGLIHNIGALPMLTRAEDVPSLLANEDLLDSLISRLQNKIGASILRSWNFPEELVTAVEENNNYQYESGNEKADYTDVVIVAKLQNIMGTDHPDAQLDWSAIPSFHKLGLAPEISVIEMEDTAENIEAAKRMLGS